jgi:hypothetical protein
MILGVMVIKRTKRRLNWENFRICEAIVYDFLWIKILKKKSGKEDLDEYPSLDLEETKEERTRMVLDLDLRQGWRKNKWREVKRLLSVLSQRRVCEESSRRSTWERRNYNSQKLIIFWFYEPL